MKDDRPRLPIDLSGPPLYISDSSPTDSTSDEDEDTAFYELYQYRDSTPCLQTTCPDFTYFDYDTYLGIYDAPSVFPLDGKTVSAPVAEKELPIRPDASADSTCLTCRITFNKKPIRCPNCGKPVIVKGKG